MTRRKSPLWLLALACLLHLVVQRPAAAYLVGPALPLEEVAKKSDLICKAEVVSTKPVRDAWFDEVSGYEPSATELKILAVYKGTEKRANVTFHHYSPAEESPIVRMYTPQQYKLTVGRTYLVFAAKSDKQDVYRQLWKHHTSQPDQGILWATASVERPDKPLKEVVWHELTALLSSKNSDNVKYAISHLNDMSAGQWGNPVEYPREQVLNLMRQHLSETDANVVEQILRVLATESHLVEGAESSWLARLGQGHIPRVGSSLTTKSNDAAKTYWKDLAALVDSHSDPKIRSLAVRALGRAETPEIRPFALKWMKDPDPFVAESAIVLLTDYLEEGDQELLKGLSSDSRRQVRTGVATAIGFGQIRILISVLDTLLKDEDKSVTLSAGRSLVSFSLDDSRETLQANRKHPAYGPLFVNALAQGGAREYIDDLCDIILNNRQPENWSGFVVWGDSWECLFELAQSSSKDELARAPLSKILDALEAPASGNTKAPTYYSSSEPRDLYALYLQKGMIDRASAFRKQCKKVISYDIDYYFKQADANPGLYTRNRR